MYGRTSSRTFIPGGSVRSQGADGADETASHRRPPCAAANSAISASTLATDQPGRELLISAHRWSQRPGLTSTGMTVSACPAIDPRRGILPALSSPMLMRHDLVVMPDLVEVYYAAVSPGTAGQLRAGAERASSRSRPPPPLFKRIAVSIPAPLARC